MLCPQKGSVHGLRRPFRSRLPEGRMLRGPQPCRSPGPPSAAASGRAFLWGVRAETHEGDFQPRTVPPALGPRTLEPWCQGQRQAAQ